MEVERYPVLVWKDHAGFYSAAWVEEDEMRAAVSTSEADAIKQVREYLTWCREQSGRWREPAPFKEAKMLWFGVDVQPEYVVDDRTYPVAETVRLRVPCVLGRRHGDLLCCAIPTLPVTFEYYQGDSVKPLVQHYVQAELRRLTPRELSRFLPPVEVVLHEVAVRFRRDAGSHGAYGRPRELASSADSMTRGRGRSAGPCWERGNEVSDLHDRVLNEDANLLLVGEPGVGKTTVLISAMSRLRKSAPDEEGRWPDRYWRTTAARLIAGMRWLGQWEERCEKIIDELSELEGILCVESLIDLVRLGGHGAGDSLAAFFLPYLRRGELRMIGEASPAEIDACRRLLPGLVDVFQIFEVPRFSRERALTVLKRNAEHLRRSLRVDHDERVPATTLRLFERFLPYECFPGKAVSFVNQLVDLGRREKLDRVDVEEVIALFQQQTGLPEMLLRDEYPLTHVEVTDQLRRKVVGQDGACSLVADFILAFKAGLNDPGRPLGVLLFCGPTGVGKTELAKSIATFLFGGAGSSDERLIRLDMSEYGSSLAAYRLLGQAGGDESPLIKRMRQQPLAVVLLDEIEKADPSVFDMLMGVFDEGRLTDRFGRRVWFNGAIIILTSNLGVEEGHAIGFDPERSTSFDDAVRRFFRPEFYNRIDAVVTFDGLSSETIQRITSKEISEVAARDGFVERNLRLVASDRLIDYLGRRGFDERYGARPLQRAIEVLVVTPLSEYLVKRPELRDTELRLELKEDGKLAIEVGGAGESSRS